MRHLPCLLVGLLLISHTNAFAWHEKEHTAIAQHALMILPQSMPAFFRTDAGQIAHSSIDPDVIKHRKLSQIRTTEHPEHYIDLELLGGAPLPSTRHEFIKLCHTKGMQPEKVGFLPYAIMEWAQRLTVALAEYRKWPDNPYIKTKCLVYAGILSHYTADLHQPLHTTIHFDGRAKADGSSPQSGIHMKMDALLRKLDMTAPSVTNNLTPQAHTDLRAAVLQNLNASFKRVDHVYTLEKHLPDYDATSIESSAVRDFATERLRRSIAFTASVFLTCWEDSAKLKLESWLDREATDQNKKD